MLTSSGTGISGPEIANACSVALTSYRNASSLSTNSSETDPLFVVPVVVPISSSAENWVRPFVYPIAPPAENPSSERLSGADESNPAGKVAVLLM